MKSPSPEAKQNEPAFPRDHQHDGHNGMNLRDYFAAHAPQMPPALREMAKIAEKADGRDTSDFGAAAKYEAMWRWAYASEMLKAREAA